MPHVIVKMRREIGSPKEATRAANYVRDIFNHGEESVSVAMEETKSKDWAEKVYKPDIVDKLDQLYQKPGYTA